MVDLLKFLITSITGSEDFDVVEDRNEEGRVNLDVTANPDIVGLIIGKEGRTIKNLRKILSIKATRENLGVNINVSPRA